jgi:hypothetical protein
MKNLLFFTAAALLLVESTVAYADPPGQNVALAPVFRQVS